MASPTDRIDEFRPITGSFVTRLETKKQRRERLTRELEELEKEREERRAKAMDNGKQKTGAQRKAKRVRWNMADLVELEAKAISDGATIRQEVESLQRLNVPHLPTPSCTLPIIKKPPSTKAKHNYSRSSLPSATAHHLSFIRATVPPARPHARAYSSIVGWITFIPGGLRWPARSTKTNASNQVPLSRKYLTPISPDCKSFVARPETKNQREERLAKEREEMAKELEEGRREAREEAKQRKEELQLKQGQKARNPRNKAARWERQAQKEERQIAEQNKRYQTERNIKEEELKKLEASGDKAALQSYMKQAERKARKQAKRKEVGKRRAAQEVSRYVAQLEAQNRAKVRERRAKVEADVQAYTEAGAYAHSGRKKILKSSLRSKVPRSIIPLSNSLLSKGLSPATTGSTSVVPVEPEQEIVDYSDEQTEDEWDPEGDMEWGIRDGWEYYFDLEEWAGKVRGKGKGKAMVKGWIM